MQTEPSMEKAVSACFRRCRYGTSNVIGRAGEEYKLEVLEKS